MTLKSVNQTRQESRKSNATTHLEQLKWRGGNSRDMKTGHAAQYLLDQVASPRFICSVIILYAVKNKMLRSPP